MSCHIINRHQHAVQITDIDFPLHNIYIVESQHTISFSHSMKFSLFCPTCGIGNYPGTSNSIQMEFDNHKFYYIEHYLAQGNFCWWWCPCFDLCDSVYLEMTSESQLSRKTSQNIVFI